MALDLAGERDFSAESGKAGDIARELDFRQYQCSTLLARAEYQILLTDAPNVPPEELRAAIRWRVKDLLSCDPDDAMLDLLDIPAPPGESRALHQLLVVAAENAVIKTRVDRFAALRIPLSVIEIPETAQRNLATLVHDETSGVALVHLLDEGALITISCSGELYFSRWIDIGTAQLAVASAERGALFERMTLELQRSFDHFEREYRSIGVARLLVGPLPEEYGLVEHLEHAMGVPVLPYPLASAFADGAEQLGDSARQSRLFHLLGAVLREEPRTL